MAEEEDKIPVLPFADALEGAPGVVVPLELESELSDSFMRYAMSIIMGRALPDLRDGLKPVHRRILFAMHELGLRPNGGYRKCARVVGEVLGKFHPHGDLSVYDALVRMAQDFVMSQPLVQGHGNFGSLDQDPPAAMRYTECKLSRLSASALLADLDQDTVDFAPNFDGNEREPLVLPARLPTLLLNGATGIAVGMATNVPPHNLAELCDALDLLIETERLGGGGAEAASPSRVVSDEALLALVPGPDFPTGGLILGTAGAKSLYTTGKGSVVVRARAGVETVEVRMPSGRVQSREAIVVTEVPYLCNKAALLEKVAGLVNEKRLLGVSDLRDESDRDGVRVVIELKRDASAQVVLNNLYQKTGLQTTFSGNFLALRHGGTSPGRFTLREALDEFLDFRLATVKRRAAHRRSGAAQRAHVVDGLLAAIANIDAVIDVVRREPTRAAAKQALMLLEPMALSSSQAEAVLGLQLGRLTSLDEAALGKEKASLARDLAYLAQVLDDDDDGGGDGGGGGGDEAEGREGLGGGGARGGQLRPVPRHGAAWAEIRGELAELRASHGAPRRTEVVETTTGGMGGSGVVGAGGAAGAADGFLSEESLIPNGRSVVVVTRSGYIKRMALDNGDFNSVQRRGTRGKAGASLRKTAGPRAQAQAAGRATAGRATAGGGEDEEDEEEGEEEEGEGANQGGGGGDEVAHFFTCNDHDTVLFITLQGTLHGVKAWQVPAAARTAKGVPLPTLLPNVFAQAKNKGGSGGAATGSPLSAHTLLASVLPVTLPSSFESAAGDAAAAAAAAAAAQYLVLVTKQGFILRTPLEAFRMVHRRRAGVKGILLRAGDQVKWARLCNGDADSAVLATRLGFATHMRLDEAEVKARKRATKGSRAMQLRPGDEIVDVDVLPCSRQGGVTEDEAAADGRLPSQGHAEDPRRDLLVVTADGYGKRVAVSEFRQQRRGGMGIIATKFKKNKAKGAAEAEEPGLACLRACRDDDEILLSTTAGVMVRQRVSAIPRQSRTATGVVLQKLDEGTTISEVALVPNNAMAGPSDKTPHIDAQDPSEEKEAGAEARGG